MPMTREARQSQAASVRETWDKADWVVLLDFSGVNVEMITDLRAAFRKGGVEYRVVKNNVLKKALEGTDIVGVDQFLAHLKGPTAFATSFAPCAKLSNAAETISGIPNNTLRDLFRFSKPSDCLRIAGIITTQTSTPIAAPISKAVCMSILMIFLSPLSAR